MQTVADTTSQSSINNILDAINEVCYELNPNLNIVYANSSACSFWNKLYADVIGKSIKCIFPNIVNTHILELLTQALQNQIQLKEEVLCPLLNKWILLIINPSATGIVVMHVDITDHVSAHKEEQQNQKSLQQHQELLQSVFDTSLVAMSSLQAVRDEHGIIQDFTILLVNKELEKQTQRTDLIGKFYAQEYPGIKQNGLFGLMTKVMEDGKPQQMEYHYTRDGFDHWFNSMFVKVDDGLVATNQDITERKLIEQEKNKGLILLQETEHLAHLGSWEYNLQTGSFTWSDGMYRLFNTAKHINTTPEIYLQYATPKSKPAAQRIVDGIKEGKSSFEETLEVDLNGDIKMLKIKSSVVYDDDKVIKVLGIDMDVTAMNFAENKMHEDAAMIKGIADAAPDMLYIIDVKDLRMIYANNNVLKLLHKSMEEIKALGPQLFDEIVFYKDRNRFNQNINSMVAAGDNEVKELLYRVVDGNNNIHWIKTRRTVYKRDENGVPVQIIGISQNITSQVILKKRNFKLKVERKELEERQKKEIFRVTISTQEEERKRIAESLHNGIGQLLYAVKINLTHLKSTSNDNTFTVAKKTTEQLLGEAIKESRRISHELTPTILEDFGLAEAVRDLCKQFNGDIRLKCHLKGLNRNLDKYIEVSVYRIIQELIINMLKHARATEASVNVDQNEKNICIVVQDNGIGLNAEKVKDRGIGLKTIFNKVRLLNGQINIENSSGTTVMVTMPYHLL